MSTSSQAVPPSVGLPDGIEKRSIHGRGHGLFATRDFVPREQILFIKTPLISALETSQLQTTCYACLRSGEAQTISNTSNETEGIELKTCTGCRTVRFCNKACQRTAWKSHHKHECPIYAKLQPRILPPTVRGVMRLLLQRQHDQLRDEDWSQLFELESHQEQLSQAGGEKWENIFLMTKALKTYSNSPESIDTIVRICCTMMVNSFALTTPTMDPIGVVMHPLPALINHSCKPNVFVRFDMSTETRVSPPPKIHHGSISIHALKPIKAGEELRITYIDATTDVSRRRSELKERYFFDCDCPACRDQTDKALTAEEDHMAKLADRTIFKSATDILLASSSKPPALLPQYLPLLREALKSLQGTEELHNIWEYPYPQLRHQLVLALIASQDFYNAMLHNMVLHFVIDPQLYEELWHPCALVSQWRLLRLINHQLDEYHIDEIKSKSKSFEPMMLAVLSVALITGLEKSVLTWRGSDSTHPVGQFELMVAQMLEDIEDGIEMAGAVASDRKSLGEELSEWCKARVKDVMSEEFEAAPGIEKLLLEHVYDIKP